MKKRFFSCIGGGGNSRLTSHDQGFSLIEAFNNLSLGGESGCLNEVNYNHERGLKHELINSEPLSCLAGTLSPSGEGKEGCVGEMKENSFLVKVYSLFTSHFSLKSAAFTLAEVLVTLGIIGVVSAMTVPTLMQNYQRQSYVTQLHKVYNEVEQALLRYQTDRNALNLTEAGLSSQTAWDAMVAQYFKTVQKCDNSLTPCFPATTSYKKMSGVALNSNVYDIKTSYVLASGASVRFYYAVNGNRICFLMVDVNGKKGPNILGRDLFTLSIYNDGTIDDDGSSAPLSEADRNTLFERDCNGDTGAGDYGCFGKILNDNWQMNY